MSDVLHPNDKRAQIRYYLEQTGLRTMVETGIYLGGASGLAMLDVLDRFVVIDIQDENVAKVRDDFRAEEKVQAVCADSGEYMARLLPTIGPALFWLDAHYVVDYDTPEVLDKYPVPLVRELEAIRAWEHAAASVVLVDDVRLLGAYGWPSMQAVRSLTDDVWDVRVADDILRAVPL